MSKLEEVGATGEEIPEPVDHDVVLGEKEGTFRDIEDMKRMGKEQLFKVSLGHSPNCCTRTRLTRVSHSVILASSPFSASP